MGQIILIVTLLGIPTPFNFQSAERACKFMAETYPNKTGVLFRRERDENGQVVRIRMQCLPPVVVPESTIQTIVPEHTDYPYEDIPE
jgi:hypothetical protein